MADRAAGGHDVPLEAGAFMTPMLRIPWFSKAADMVNSQHNECGFFEKNYYACMEAFGMSAGRMHCQLEGRDFTECVQLDKTRARYDAIKRERLRQLVTGERDRAFEDIDLFVPIHTRNDHYDHNKLHQT